MPVELDYNGNKGFRLLAIYERLNKGELVKKEALAQNFGVTNKTIQRDIDDLRAYYAETHPFESEIEIRYDRIRKGYYLVKFDREWLTNQEVLGLCKVLLESRAFNKTELNNYLEKLLAQVVPSDRNKIRDLIQSERAGYVPLQHEQALLDRIWALSLYVYEKEQITFTYQRQDQSKKVHSVKPVALMFSEFYFYLLAYQSDESKTTPTIFRVDRIEGIRGEKKSFQIPYAKQFSSAEFRKRVQFMYSGELRTVRFRYTGPSLEAILDRLPTAKVLKQDEEGYLVEAEVLGDGIDMWMKGQGGITQQE